MANLRLVFFHETSRFRQDFVAGNYIDLARLYLRDTPLHFGNLRTGNLRGNLIG
jgi:hypothetical protein